MFEAVILAGGKGTRLKSITGDIPKPLIDVAGQPFLYWIMKNLESQGCEKIVLSVGYRSEYFVSRVQTDSPVSIEVEFSIESQPLGTGGAVKLSAEKIRGSKFVVLNGDTFLDMDYSQFLRFSSNSDLCMSCARVSDVSRYGAVDLDEQSYVKTFHEKGRSGPGYINSGVYSISKEKILDVSEDCFSFEKAVLSKPGAKILAYPCDGYFIDIGIPEDYGKACEDFLTSNL